MNLHFIHGFLGLHSDWHQFTTKFNQYNLHFHSIEDFISTNNNENTSLINWAQNFNQKIFSSLKFKSEKNILIGYSLGGRLALHCLCEHNNWHAAIIISANPGLTNATEKIARLKNDENWAQKFRTQDWNTVLTEWNSQSVFSGQKNNLNREEILFNKEKVAHMLTEFSLAKQEDLRNKIKEIKIPILWLAGEQDTKFSTIANEMETLNKNIKTIIIPNAGHRIPWENSQEFTQLTKNLILTQY